MITPSFAITATERVLPSMALDFTTAILDSRITFTRAGNTATVTNSSGAIVAINADLPRFDYNPVTLVCKGLLVEELRTNLFVNSLLNGTSLSTQLVTTTAVAHTLSFYGTGQIVLTGTSSATVVGTGAYPNRQTLTFTPTAGVLTLTVTGTVQYAQLEVGSFPTSFIPTAATSVTRNADVAVMTGTNFSSWYNQTSGTFVLTAITNVVGSPNFPGFFRVRGAAIGDSIGAVQFRAAGQFGGNARVGGVSQGDVTVNGLVAGTEFKGAVAYATNDLAVSFNASAVATDTSVNLPTVDTLDFSNVGGTSQAISGYLIKLNYYPMRLTNAELQAFTK